MYPKVLTKFCKISTTTIFKSGYIVTHHQFYMKIHEFRFRHSDNGTMNMETTPATTWRWQHSDGSGRVVWCWLDRRIEEKRKENWKDEAKNEKKKREKEETIRCSNLLNAWNGEKDDSSFWISIEFLTFCKKKKKRKFLNFNWTLN